MEEYDDDEDNNEEDDGHDEIDVDMEDDEEDEEEDEGLSHWHHHNAFRKCFRYHHHNIFREPCNDFGEVEEDSEDEDVEDEGEIDEDGENEGDEVEEGDEEEEMDTGALTAEVAKEAGYNQFGHMLGSSSPATRARRMQLAGKSTKQSRFMSAAIAQALCFASLHLSY